MSEGRAAVGLEVGPGLAFRFEGLPTALEPRIRRYYRHFLRARPGSGGAAPFVVRAAPPPAAPPAERELVVSQPPLSVYRVGPLVLCELPGAVAWCDPARGAAGFALDAPSDRTLDCLVHLAFDALLFELAPARGWMGLHAAAVAPAGGGVLLPGPSGCGKSTIVRHADAGGLPVLSDDLVWLRESPAGFRLHAFPRGLDPPSAPEPTADEAPLRAIVCPSITGRNRSRLVPMPLAECLRVLTLQAGFLATGAASGERFRGLIRAAGGTPCYRLEAGRDFDRVPSLLAELVELGPGATQPPGETEGRQQAPPESAGS